MLNRIGLLLTLALLSLTSCVGLSGSRPREKAEAQPSNTMHLYRIDVDGEAVKNGARLLFAEPPPRSSSGHQRRAQGFFKVSDAGFCRIEVRCAEPVVGLSGRKSEQVYTLLDFYGRIAEDGTRATTTAGETATVGSTRAADEVRFLERGRDKITVQAILGGKPQAYLLHFYHTAIGSKSVRVPWQP